MENKAKREEIFQAKIANFERNVFRISSGSSEERVRAKRGATLLVLQWDSNFLNDPSRFLSETFSPHFALFFLYLSVSI